MQQMAVRLNGIFKDNMVFQWGAELRVFGTTDSRFKITAKLLKGRKIICQGSVIPEKDGSFLIGLKGTDNAGGPYTLEVLSGSTKKTVKNCYAGEVWLAVGQSNMEYPLRRTEFAEYLINKISKTDIHFYNVPAPTAGEYDDDLRKREEESKWQIIDSSTAGDMSGVAFYFAREIEEMIDCKIGIIGCYMAGTSIDNWISVDVLGKTKTGKKYIKDFEARVQSFSAEEYREELAEFNAYRKVYEDKLAEVLESNPYTTYKECDLLIGPMDAHPPASWKGVMHPGAMYDNMLSRIIPFMLRGVIYYQGESDCDEHCELYGDIFATLIKSWREAFYNPEMPFVFCQLPMYISRERRYMDYDDMRWPRVREQQQIVAIDVPHSYMAVIPDCGEFDNIHPSDKRTPGQRLALMALKFVYGFESVDAVAPYIIDARRGEGIEVTFSGDFNTLNLVAGFNSDETGFEICGEDGEYYNADATIDLDGKTVLLQCRRVENPVKVRYAYCSYGPTPLVAQNGLAAAPFCVNIEKALGTTI